VVETKMRFLKLKTRCIIYERKNPIVYVLLRGHWNGQWLGGREYSLLERWPSKPVTGR